MSSPEWATTEQIRAMVHPLRLRILDALRNEGPATATRLAELLGESTGATSYHVRVLADARVVEEVPELAKGRERWWRRTRPIYMPTGAETPEGRALEHASILVDAEHDDQALHQYILGMDGLPQEWREAALMGSWRLHLNPTELYELGMRLLAIISELRRSEAESPPDAREIMITMRALPSTKDDAT